MQTAGGRKFVKHFARQTIRFAPENKNITRPELWYIKSRFAAYIGGETVAVSGGGDCGGKRIVRLHIRIFAIIQTGTPQKFVRHFKPKFAGEMQNRPAIRGKPNRIPRIRRNLRIQKNDVKHCGEFYNKQTEKFRTGIINAMNAADYKSGFGLPAEVIRDSERAHRLFHNKWFFAGTRGDIPQARDYFTFALHDDDYFLLHGDDGVIRCFVNRCAHQSARLLREHVGCTDAALVCPNHQWSYHINTGKLRAAPMMGRDFAKSAAGKCTALTQIPVREVSGMLFARLHSHPDHRDMDEIAEIISPYTAPFAFGDGKYKLAHHHREIVPANWLMVMINNRECCHCRANHKGLCDLFDPSSFNGARSPAYDRLFAAAVLRWKNLGLAWEEQAFTPNDCCRIARYPMREGYKSITFDGKPASRKLIGKFADYDASTLSMWFNPNAWIHFTSDHIATNWVLPLDEARCTLYSSWIVAADAVEGEDYEVDHLTEVWRITNAEDVALCNSMTVGARSRHYRPGPFSENERWCRQFCDWYMQHS